MTGAVRGHRCRVVITGQTMHVVHSPTKIEKVALTGELEADEVRGGRGYLAWTVLTEKGLVLMTNRGCPTCNYRLGSVPLSKILA